MFLDFILLNKKTKELIKINKIHGEFNDYISERLEKGEEIEKFWIMRFKNRFKDINIKYNKETEKTLYLIIDVYLTDLIT